MLHKSIGDLSFELYGKEGHLPQVGMVVYVGCHSQLPNGAFNGAMSMPIVISIQYVQLLIIVLSLSLSLSLFSNRAECYLKTNKFCEAIRDCNKALAMSPRNLKARWRRAQAFQALEKDYPAALDLL